MLRRRLGETGGHDGEQADEDDHADGPQRTREPRRGEGEHAHRAAEGADVDAPREPGHARGATEGGGAGDRPREELAQLVEGHSPEPGAHLPPVRRPRAQPLEVPAMKMDHQPLNLSWVTPQLAVGGSYPITAAAHLASDLDVRHVVDLRVESCDDEEILRGHGIELLHLPTQDACGVSLELLDDGVIWVNAKLDAGKKVYVHCEHGIGRSALLVMCVLVSRGETPLGALSRIKSARRKVSPSPEQLETFRAWLAAFRANTGEEVAIPSFDELALVAYSHLREAAEVAESAAP